MIDESPTTGFVMRERFSEQPGELLRRPTAHAPSALSVPGAPRHLGLLDAARAWAETHMDELIDARENQ
ncbi:hypothetical protein [Nonomuraea sp. B1E8]|uniref:hypothetical protein n=1 Tax=unclassified Nonomuraea TaxID=2593643 RepID=UPI00325C8719